MITKTGILLRKRTAGRLEHLLQRDQARGIEGYEIKS